MIHIHCIIQHLVSSEGCAPPPLVGFVRTRQRLSTLHSNKIKVCTTIKCVYTCTMQLHVYCSCGSVMTNSYRGSLTHIQVCACVRIKASVFSLRAYIKVIAHVHCINSDSHLKDLPFSRIYEFMLLFGYGLH